MRSARKGDRPLQTSERESVLQGMRVSSQRGPARRRWVSIPRLSGLAECPSRQWNHRATHSRAFLRACLLAGARLRSRRKT